MARLHPVLRQWATYQDSERIRWISAAPTDLLRLALQTWEDAARVGRATVKESARETEAVIVEVRRVLALRRQENRRRICPACGYTGLLRPPYLGYEGPEMALGTRPPYGLQWGTPSRERCPCCGYRFGYHDARRPGETPMSFDDWRGAWLAAGSQWVDGTRRPAGWNAVAQLAQTGLWDCSATLDVRVLTLYNGGSLSPRDRETGHGDSNR